MKIIANPIDPKMLKFGDLFSVYPQEAWDRMFTEQISHVDIGMKLRGSQLIIPIPLYKIIVDLTQERYPGWD